MKLRPLCLSLVLAFAFCAPAASRAAIIYTERFANDSTGWLLDNEWQIGPAVASPPEGNAPRDPGVDTTPTADNGVAGVVLGGNYTTALHSYYYLESPSINLSGASGTVLMGFQRSVGSDYLPYAQVDVEVFNGTSWVVLWQSEGSPGMRDLGWVPVSFDITAYVSANFKLRFGHRILNGGALSMCGWNIDDVTIATNCVDADGDTYASAACGGPDCDDSNAAVYPGATEICNGIDDNCNGQVDEGLGSAYYVDLDGDGWGNASGASVLACTPPTGYGPGGDCNDANPAIHPNATETCNGIDDDCDGLTDEGLAFFYYRDLDGDTYGDPTQSVLSCSTVAGYVLVSGDCNDGNANIHPGATELLNGIDDDCDGAVDEGFDAPIIRSIRDVPNDQGRNVRIRWRRDQRDQPGGSPQISGYSIYRRVEPGQAPATRSRPEGAQVTALPPGDWDIAMTVLATGDSAYQSVVATLCDSNSAGLCWSRFLVRAVATTPATYFDSRVDSGYSVDNLAPGVPGNVMANAAAGQVNLSWSASAAPDFQYFRVYRGTSASFTPAPGNLVQATAGTSWNDTAPGSGNVYYKLTAVDANGNESVPALATTYVGVGDPVMPTALAFARVAPNPFGRSTTVTFDVPSSAARVTLSVHDLAGRRVRTLASGAVGAGRHTRTWDGRDDAGRVVGSGLYFLRLESGGRVFARRVTFTP